MGATAFKNRDDILFVDERYCLIIVGGAEGAAFSGRGGRFNGQGTVGALGTGCTRQNDVFLRRRKANRGVVSSMSFVEGCINRFKVCQGTFGATKLNVALFGFIAGAFETALA